MAAKTYICQGYYLLLKTKVENFFERLFKMMD